MSGRWPGASATARRARHRGRPGTLCCGENTNPLARFALIAQGEQVHVANYPARGLETAFRSQSSHARVTLSSVTSAGDVGPIRVPAPSRDPATAQCLREQVERNYRAFAERLPGLMASHQGKFALMRDGDIVEFFDTARDAYVAGQRLFKDDQVFSVQEVVEAPVDLGFFSHAVSQR